jgi:hypothetical protein
VPRRKRLDPGVDLTQFISGIYNYCDRWCARCPMTAKCYLYWQEQQTAAEHRAAGRDPHDWAVVMEDVRKQFERAIEMLREMADEHGIDLESAPEMEEAAPDPTDHPLNQRARDYMSAAHAFLEDLRQRITEEHAALEERAMILGPERAAGNYQEILDAFEVISWYHTLLPAKVYRALGSKLEAEQDGDPESRKFHLDDALGTARVAHESVVRSMAALQRVYEWDDGLEDRIIPLLADLEWLRNQVEGSFPGFRDFKRPGLDPD